RDQQPVVPAQPARTGRLTPTSGASGMPRPGGGSSDERYHQLASPPVSAGIDRQKPVGHCPTQSGRAGTQKSSRPTAGGSDEPSAEASRLHRQTSESVRQGGAP